MYFVSTLFCIVVYLQNLPSFFYVVAVYVAHSYIEFHFIYLLYCSFTFRLIPSFRLSHIMLCMLVCIFFQGTSAEELITRDVYIHN